MEPVEQLELIQEALPMLGNPKAGSSALALAELLSLFSLQEAKKYIPQILSSLTQLNDQASRFVTAVLLDPKPINTQEKNEILKKLVEEWYNQAFLPRPLELAKMFPYISAEERATFIADVLVETDRLSERHTRSYALRHILPFAPLDKRETLLNELIDTALSIKASSKDFLFGGVIERAQELSCIARFTPESKRDLVIKEAIRAIFKMYSDWSRKGGLRLMYGSDFFCEYIANLLPVLSEESALDLIDHAASRLLIGDRWRVGILLYPKLAPKDAIATRQRLVSQMLEPYTPEKQYIIYSMIRTCTQLAYILTGECKQAIVNRALSIVNSLENISFRVRALLYIVPHLEGSTQQKILQQAFEGIEAMPFAQQREELERFATEVTGLPDHVEVWACIRALRLAGDLERIELLAVLQALAPRIRAVGGIEAAHEVVRALDGIGAFFA